MDNQVLNSFRSILNITLVVAFAVALFWLALSGRTLAEYGNGLNNAAMILLLVGGLIALSGPSSYATGMGHATQEFGSVGNYIRRLIQPADGALGFSLTIVLTGVTMLALGQLVIWLAR